MSFSGRVLGLIRGPYIDTRIGITDKRHQSVSNVTRQDSSPLYSWFFTTSSRFLHASFPPHEPNLFSLNHPIHVHHACPHMCMHASTYMHYMGRQEKNREREEKTFTCTSKERERERGLPCLSKLELGLGLLFGTSTLILFSCFSFLFFLLLNTVLPI